ncbi:hypothetical protein AAFN88_14860 [Pelagibius sp. CAU 1746]|uniref:hypothetical protein n=1 Tax=Pelagibius sp. CAU 1746 TaxID=3140370 RepID=UPI00325AD1C0
MQKFEWYLGYMARAARTCGNFNAADKLHALARMTPYGGAGLNTVTGDGFAGPVCGGINREAGEMAADAERIRAYIEDTYDCKGEGCHGQDLSDWQFHACGNSLKSHFAILGLDDDDIRAVTMLDPKKTGSDADFQARVQFHSCQGSLYIDLTKHCVMENKQTRGDCSFDGIERY